MRFLDRLCCTLLGLTLSAAGLLLLVDPFATASHLYCGLIPAILLSAVIMIAGIGTLCGLRRKTLSIVALVPTAVALVVSLLSGHIRLTGLCLILLPMAIYHLVYSWREGNGRAPAWFDRVALEVRSQIDPNTDANVWRGYARFVAGFNDWRGAFAGGVDSGADL